MFGNRLVYTQSPGGIRRGLIWQSGGDISPIKRDDRYNLWTPWSPVYTQTVWNNALGYDIEMPGGYPIYDEEEVLTEHQSATGFKIPISAQTQIQCPYYTYVSSTDIDSDGNYFLTSFADELSYYADIDIYIDPTMMNVTDIDDDFIAPIISEVSQHFTIDHSSQELRSLPKPFNIGYYVNSAGEIKEAYSSTSPISYDAYMYLSNPRISYPSCPMRIQMRLVYSDYPFALSGAFTGGGTAARTIEFPFETSQAYLTSILDDYNMPPDEYFNGCNIKSKFDGTYYDSFSFPSFEQSEGMSGTGIRKSKYSSATDYTKFYRYTEGALYDGLDYGAQLYLSPLLYPATYGTGSVLVNDYQLWLPSVASDISTQKMQQHASPYMIPPTIKMPALTRLRYTNGGQTLVPVYGTGGYRIRFNDGDYTSNDNDIPFMGSPHASYYNVASSMLGAKGLVLNTTTSIAPSWVSFNNITGAGAGSYDDIQGFLQPKIVKGEKYTQTFRCICAKGDTVSNSSGQFTGRFKYLGIRGKISFFETRQT